MMLLEPSPADAYFLPYQQAWLRDQANLKIMEKSRQIGISFTDAYDSVIKAGQRQRGLDVWVSSRDETQARLYLDDCRNWARILRIAAEYEGARLLDETSRASAHVLEFATGARIFCLSCNPNALAGKRGHVKLDEFALHQDQRLLYRVAKPVTQWGGSLSLISTHRGAHTLFNQIIRAIREGGNPMGWSLHSVPLQTAVDQGLVERINAKTGREESREAFVARLRRECIDEEHWLQEYCCIPADESAAFISLNLIEPCESEDCLTSPAALAAARHPLYAGVDVARVRDLCVIDVGELVGDVMWDRLRLELRDQSFAAIEAELFEVLRFPALVRLCIDATGLGRQLAERARQQFGWQVEPVIFTRPLKEQLAFNLRAAFENRTLRIARDDRLRADLRGLRKAVTPAGNLRFDGESADGHCDRTWALALRLHAAALAQPAGALAGR